MAAFIRFHVQDSNGAPIGAALISTASPFGPWQGMTNDCGDFFTPAPGLAPGVYNGNVSAPGFVSRQFQWNFGDSGEVYVGLERAVSPTRPTLLKAKYVGCVCRVAAVPGGAVQPPCCRGSMIIFRVIERVFVKPKRSRLTHVLLSWRVRVAAWQTFNRPWRS
jgi:hypothetical protein